MIASMSTYRGLGNALNSIFIELFESSTVHFPASAEL